MPSIDPALTQLYQYTLAASSQSLAVAGDRLAISSVYLKMGDTIQSGTADGAEYLKDLSVYITDQETLLATLESMASNVGGGAGTWISSGVSSLHDAISSEITLLYANGGSISNLPECAAMSSIPGSGIPGSSGGIASAANFESGPGISQAGVGNSAGGFDIEQAGNSNTAWGSWLDAMGGFNFQNGAYLLAIGSYNIENGDHDVANGTSNTISGSFDTIVGNNNTIIGNSARVFGSGLSALAGQTVFGTTSNFTVINANGTWSTVVNGSAVPTASGNAFTNSSLMTLESQAIADASGAAQTNYVNLVSQYAGLGYSQVLSLISADITSGNFGVGNFVSSTVAAGSAPAANCSGLSSGDAVAVATLSGLTWGASTSASIMATLSGIATRDTSSTILGAEAAAALKLISSGINPQALLTFIVDEANDYKVTSSQTSLNGFSAQDITNTGIAFGEEQAGNSGALATTLSALTTSSNSVVASIASAELVILSKDGVSATNNGIWAIDDFITNNSKGAIRGSQVAAELSSATGSSMMWTGSSFVVSASTTAAPLPIASGLSSADAAAVSSLDASVWGACTSAAIMSTLSSIIGNDGPQSYLGVDAAAALRLISAGVNPGPALDLLKWDASNPIMTSSATRSDGVSVQDAAYINIANAEFNTQDWSGLSTTLAILATSSNPTVASIASAELLIAANDGGRLWLDPGVSGALYADYEQGKPISSATISTMLDEIMFSTGRSASWTGSAFVLPGAN
jgi:hypothetical protein